MKKINVLLLSLVAVGSAVVSCSKNEPAAPTAEGKWIFTTVDVMQNGTKVETDPYVPAGCTNKMAYLDLKTAGIGQLQAVDSTCTEHQAPMTWKNENNTLKVSINGQQETSFPIVSLTSNTMVFKQDAQGYTLNFNLKKQ